MSGRPQAFFHMSKNAQENAPYERRFPDAIADCRFTLAFASGMPAGHIRAAV